MKVPHLRVVSRTAFCLATPTVFAACGPQASETERRERLPPASEPACKYIDREIGPADQLVVGGIEVLQSALDDPFTGDVTTSWTPGPVSGELDIMLDFDAAVIRTPTGIPGPRQVCPEWLDYPFEIELRLQEGPTFRFQGTGTTNFPAAWFLISQSDHVTISGNVPESLEGEQARPRLRLDTQGAVDGDIRLGPSSADPDVVAEFSFRR